MKTIGSISYGIAALGFVVLAVLLAVNWRGRRPGGYLLAASGLTAAWAAVLASIDSDNMPLLLVYRTLFCGWGRSQSCDGGVP